MTDQDIDSTKALIPTLWRGTAKWTDEEWTVWTAGAERIQIDAAQAKAALRAYKATSDKYPTVAGLLAAMKRAEGTPTRAGCSPATGGHQSWASVVRASHAKATHPIDGSDLDVIRAYHRRIADKQQRTYHGFHQTAIRDAFRDFERILEHEEEIDGEVYALFGDDGLAAVTASRALRRKCIGVSRTRKVAAVAKAGA